MTEPATVSTEPHEEPAPAPAARGVVLVGYASFLLLGWTSLLIPSLIRDVQASFGQSDAGMGLAYLLNALVYVTGTLSIGVVSARVPRRALLATGPGLVLVGLVTVSLAPTWPVFLLGFMVAGLGLGVIDAGINALFIDLYSGRAGMLNRLHMFFALGALGAPLAVGLAVTAGAPWQAATLVTALAAVPMAFVFATRRLPPSHPPSDARAPAAPNPAAPSPAASASPAVAWRGVPVPLVLLSIAIACYVASELGISSWLVRYLEDAPIAVATLALSLFWGALGLSRFVSSFIADRMGAVVFATTWAFISGAAILAALVAAPNLPIVIVCFAVAGFAAGPIFPSIMAIGGALHPGRASMVSSVLTSAGIAGSIVYPPLMGVVSEAAGLWVGIAGAGLFAMASGLLIYLASRAGRGREAAAT
jgi:FHS family glucose/mannose:H+ symporter-like MFS transporter